MSNVALITGASSGIGRELAKLHASQGGDLIVVARREGALKKLKSELESAHGINVLCVSADLTDLDSVQRIYDEVQQQNIEIDVLINNAGIGGHGKFHERPWEKDKSMINLNIMALTAITRKFLPDMVAQKRGKILNVASTAGFLPGPLQAVYYATKAYVLSFSQAIAEELKEDNITVTTLCPGPVATGFTDAADMEGVAAFKNAVTPASVAKVGYEAMQKGKLVVINDWKLSFMLRWIVPFLPRRMMLRMSRNAMEKTN